MVKTTLSPRDAGRVSRVSGRVEAGGASRAGAGAAGAIRRLVFIDPGVADHARLLAELEPGVSGRVLEAGQDGLAQVAAAVERHSGLESVSILAHGAPGTVTLGAGVLCEATLASHAAALRAIGRAIAPGGCLALYACEFGRGAGAALVGRIARLAGVAVAAPAEPVGGGRAVSWELRTGDAVVAPPLRAGVLAAYAPTLAGAGAPPAGFPISVSNFNTISSGGTFLLSGTAPSVTASGQLQLTPNLENESGVAVYSQPFSSAEGLTFNFTYVSAGGSGADGIVFFLLNGDSLGSTITSTSVTAGQLGASIGYSDGINSSGTNGAGITDGYLGIGFDTFGNFSTTVAGGLSSLDTSGRTPNSIDVRGQGTGTSGYNFLGGTTYATGIDGTHAVQIDLIPTSSTTESLTVYEAPTATGSLVQVYSTTVTQALPNSFYFGFSSGTGGSTDVHDIDNVAVTIPVDLQLSQATVRDLTTGTSVGATGTLAPGDSFTYSYTLTNAGTNGDGEIVVNDALPANIVNGAWSVVDSAGTHTGTGAAISVNLLAGATATISVTGTVSPNASSGNANHVVSVSPGSAYTLSNPATDVPVTLAIGGGGSSVSLVSANVAAGTTDAAPVQPFAAAAVVDTFVDPGTGLAPGDTLTVSMAPSAGSLAASGGTYNASTGVLTATGTAAALQLVLDSLVFVPAAHTAAPGTVTPVTLVTRVTDTDASNTSGGGTPSATQTATILVTAVHDQPSVTGGAAAQPVSDTGTLAPFAGTVIADPDDTSLSVTVSLAGSAGGSFTAASAAGWTLASSSGTGATYVRSFAGGTLSAAMARAALQALVYQPAAHALSPGAVASTAFSVTVNDAQGGTATDAANAASVTAVHDAPSVSGAVAGQPVSDTGTLSPFATLAIADPDDTVLTAQVSFAAGSGDFAPASASGWTASTAAGTTTYTQVFAGGTLSAAQAQAAVRALVFQPAAHVQVPGAVTSTGFTVSVADALAATATSSVPSASVTAVHDAPSVTGGTAGQAMPDTGTLSPFGDVAIVDPDDIGLSVSVSLSGSAGGSFTAASAAGWTASAVVGGGTTYTRSFADGTLSAAAAQAALQALVFQTTPYVQPPGTVATTSFAVTVADLQGAVASDTAASVAVTSVHDQPVVSGGILAQAGLDTGTLTPFAGVSIADPDDTSLTVTVSFAGTDGGSFTAASAAGWTASGLGGTSTTYTQTFADGTLSAAAAQAALQALAFQQPAFAQVPGTVASTGFTVTVDDAQGGSGSDAAAGVAVTATAAPPLGLALDGGSDSGVAGDDITNVVDPTITGLGVAGDVVTLFEGTTVLGTATVSAAGTWSLQAGTLTSGAHTLTASEAFGGGLLPGQVSTVSAPLVVTVDTTIPQPPASLALAAASDSGVAGDDITNVVAPVITGTGTFPDTIQLFDGTTLVGTATVAASGTWSVATSILAAGTHVLTATQTEVAGNVSSLSGPLTVTVDTMAAAPTLVDTSLSTPSVQPVLEGTAPDGGSVAIFDGTTLVGTTTASAAGTYGFDFATALSAGTHTLTAVATDVAGNVSPASTPVVVTISAGGSYSVASTSTTGSTTLTSTRMYDPTGTLSEVDTANAQGQVLERVTAGTAILQIYDSAGTLIGTVTQPAVGFASQPLLATIPQSASATSAVGTVGSLIALLSESNVITTQGADTVTAGTGTDTVFAAGPSTSVTGGPGSLLLVQGTGAATLTGGAGPVTVYGGTGAGTFTGGSAGGNIMLAGAGNTTLIGGGPGDVIAAGSGQTAIVMQASSLGFGGTGAATIDGAANGLLVAGSGSTVLVAGAGAETLYGGTGNSTLFGGTGADVLSAGPSGQTVMVGGSQATTFLGAGGASTVQGSTGDDTVFAGSGSMFITEGNGADVVLLGSGASTIIGGQGVDVYDVVNGLGGGSATISGFKVGTDQVALTNYSLSAVGTQTVGGSTTLSLADGTRITLVGVTQLAANSVV